MSQYFTKLKITKNIDNGYFKILTNFIINNNFIMHNYEIYIQIVDIARGGCLSSMLADLFLYYYKCSYINNSLTLHRYINDIIIISTDNINSSIPDAYPSYLKLTENTLHNFRFKTYP